ncbi:MAG: hypothetical protein WCD79_08100, partial [Chthoniobacteraceae bacterium]
MSSSSTSSKITQFVSLLALALVLTTLNAFKPLVADDPLYLEYARQFSLHPADPYAFYYIGSVQANSILVPPVAIYWLAAGIRVLGMHVFLLKMWLLPFSMLFVFSLFSLLRRFAPKMEWPLIVLTVLSPVFLPTLNFMLDIPALGLYLTALVCFLHMQERNPWTGAIVTGLIAGVAMQTKYTSVVVLPLLFIHGFMFRRLGAAMLAIGIAIACFVGWEFVTAHLYGHSHFLSRYSRTEGAEPLFKIRLFLPLIGTLGGLSPVIAMMGLGALGASRRKVLIGMLLALSGYVLLAMLPEKYAVFIRAHDDAHQARLALNSLLFGLYGLGLTAIVLMVMRKMVTAVSPAPATDSKAGPGLMNWLPWHLSVERRIDWFLVLWVVMELGTYFVLSPFPAVRRVMGLTVIITLIIGRVASRTWLEPDRARYFRILIPVGVALGLVFYAVNFMDAWADKEVTRLAAQNIRQEQPGAKIWYMGAWGFGYYAEQAGMDDVNRGTPHAGDLLVYNRSENFREQRPVPDGFVLVKNEQVSDWLPLKNLNCFSAGRTAIE